jgi:ubiquinone/menaquinone biosynthesis C-methylase UbiE
MFRKTPNSQYNVAAPDSLPVRVATYQRRRMFARFLSKLHPALTESILDVGATSDDTYESSNYLVAWYAYKHKVTALGIDDASFLEQKFPGTRFVRGNGLNLPFNDQTFDYVHSSAVIEHVGDELNQKRMIAECARVSKIGFFMTTPNRWFPIEFHTTIPVLHWLPKKIFRAILMSVKMEFFAQESNLNLLSRGELKALASDLVDFDIRIETVSLGLWPSNLLLIGYRKQSQ